MERDRIERTESLKQLADRYRGLSGVPAQALAQARDVGATARAAGVVVGEKLANRDLGTLTPGTTPPVRANDQTVPAERARIKSLEEAQHIDSVGAGMGKRGSAGQPQEQAGTDRTAAAKSESTPADLVARLRGHARGEPTSPSTSREQLGGLTPGQTRAGGPPAPDRNERSR